MSKKRADEGGGATPPPETERKGMDVPALREYFLKDYLEARDEGDPDAALSVHSELAEALRAGELTPFMVDLLAGMHEAIAAGEPPGVAMGMKKPSHRPPKILRDRRIINSVEGKLSASRMIERDPRVRQLLAIETFKPPSKTEIFKRVGKEFELHWTTVKRIYLDYRPVKE
ncbi:hypothetical protein [Luteimonas sp. A478]